jgi:hypothetical protein
MERVEVQSMAWRLFALCSALLLALVALVKPVIAAPGFTFEGARTVYWLLAPVGLLGYAYGFRLFGETFWRFYAVIFSAEITLRFARLIVRQSSHPIGLVVFAGAATVLICVALLRHANLIGGSSRRVHLADRFR